MNILLQKFGFNCVEESFENFWFILSLSHPLSPSLFLSVFGILLHFSFGCICYKRKLSGPIWNIVMPSERP